MPGLLDLLGVAKNLIETGRLDLQATNGFGNPYNGFTDNSFLENLRWNTANSTIWGESLVSYDEETAPGIPNDWSTTGPYNFDNDFGGPGWEEVYDIDYMKDFVGIEMQGAGAEMNELMEQLQYHLSGEDPDLDIDTIIAEIAELRGENFEDMMAMYEKAQELFELEGVQEWFTPINEDTHPDFLGSNSSLRYGKVVGDIIGLDPVFAALLNPSGGIVGPGVVGSDMGNEPIGYHGIFHDAGGWMFDALGESYGPGYDYTPDTNGAGWWPDLDRDNDDGKLAGQTSGILMWNNLMHPEGNLVSNGVRSTGDLVDALLGIMGDGAEDWIGDFFGDHVPIVGELTDAMMGIANTALHEAGDVFNEISEISADLMDGDLLGAAGNTLEAIYEVGQGAVAIAFDAVQEVGEAVVDIAEDIVEVGTTVVNAVGNAAQAVGNAIGNAAQAVGNFFSGF